MKRFFPLLKLFVVLALTGCYKAANPGEPRPKSLITGECLKSPSLTFITNYNTQTYDPSASDYLSIDWKKGEPIYSGSYKFVFYMDMDLDLELEKDSGTGIVTSQRYLPSKAVFAQFGRNSAAVKSEYEKIWEQMPKRTSCTTICLKEGLSLTADKDFAGFKAGENMAGALVLSEGKGLFVDGGYDYSSLVIPFPVWPEDCGNMSDAGKAAFGFSINAKGFNLIQETVVFTLSMPVKVAQYLTWINNSLTDSKAEMIWKDEVLTCRFTTQYVIN